MFAGVDMYWLAFRNKALLQLPVYDIALFNGSIMKEKEGKKSEDRYVEVLAYGLVFLWSYMIDTVFLVFKEGYYSIDN